MVDRRKVYAVGQGGQGAKVTTYWGVHQRSVSPDAALGWNQFTCHLTIDKWDVSGFSQRVRKFHLSFKFWKKQSLEGSSQPGCTWEWNSGLSRFDFKEWFNVDSLWLNPGEGVTIATHVKKFVRGRANLLFEAPPKPETIEATFDAQFQGPTNP